MSDMHEQFGNRYKDDPSELSRVKLTRQNCVDKGFGNDNQLCRKITSTIKSFFLLVENITFLLLSCLLTYDFFLVFILSV